MKYEVLLNSGTTGEVIDNHGDNRIDTEVEDGLTVTIKARDENGNFFNETGVVAEVLQEKEDWE